MRNKEHNARVTTIAKGIGVLTQLAEDGNVWIEGSDWVGRASDGTVVSLGPVTEQNHEVAIYLASHSTPDTW